MKAQRSGFRPATGPGAQHAPQVAPSLPRRAKVTVAHGRVSAVNGQRVEHELRSWIVEDRWWTEQPIHRRYWELITETGRRIVVFHDLTSSGWFSQAA